MGTLIIGEKVYTNAHAFVPERWYSRPELIKERNAFAPFSIGMLGCCWYHTLMTSLYEHNVHLLYSCPFLVPRYSPKGLMMCSSVVPPKPHHYTFRFDASSNPL